MSKKVFSVMLGVVMCGVVASPSSVSANFSKDLQVGNIGADVVALQTLLIEKGFDIPAISSGALPKGTFGSQTKAAVQKYQKSVGVPSTGFVGPLTRGKLNGIATVAGTPAPVVTANPGTITTPGVAGTLTLSLQGSPSGASLDKGETEDVARSRLQAGASDMRITSISLDFDTRLWLYASSLTIKDDAGIIVAQKNNLSAADFTELSSTNFRLYVPVSYVVPKTQTRYFTLSVSMLPTTDRPSKVITITQAQVRSDDGTGVTDTQTLNATNSQTRSFTFTGDNTGQVVITSNENDSLDMIIPISTSAKTDNVPLGIANFMSKNRDGIMKSFDIYLTTNGISPADLFSDARIVSGNLSYSAESIGNGNLGVLTTFRNMNIPLPKDTKVPVSIVVKVKKNTNNSLDGSMASSTIIASGTAGGTSNNPVVEDSTFKTIDISDTPLITSEYTFSSNAIAITNSSVIDPSKGSVASAYNLGFAFDLMATGENPVHVSKSLFNSSGVAQLIATSSTGNITMRITTVKAEPDVIPGDSDTDYIIPVGSTRSFHVSGSVSGVAGAQGQAKITSIKYGTSAGTYDKNVIGYFLGLLKTNSISILNN